jgi:hypothetical protein
MQEESFRQDPEDHNSFFAKTIAGFFQFVARFSLGAISSDKFVLLLAISIHSYFIYHFNSAVSREALTVFNFLFIK